VDVDLRRGQTDAGGGVHRFRQVGDQLFQSVIEDGDRRRQFVQARIGVSEDV
jgi:hypothetical protein